MPTYEYVCGSCARRIEVLHGIHAVGPATCEACGGTLRKAISAAAVVFKGSGWAKKDAARASRPADRPSASDGAPAGSGEGAGDPAASDTGEGSGTAAKAASGKPSKAPASGDQSTPSSTGGPAKTGEQKDSATPDAGR